jgi:hypothetical protein
MVTWASRTNKALTIWQTLPPEQQAALLAQLNKPFMLFGEVVQDFMFQSVVQIDTTSQEPPKVVSAFFEMDVSINSRFVYLFDKDIREK